MVMLSYPIIHPRQPYYRSAQPSESCSVFFLFPVHQHYHHRTQIRKMTWPTSIVIDTVFIPLYVILFVANIPNVIKHGHKRAVGFISLPIFALLHLVGNVMLVVEYKKNYSSINVAVWGYILQSIGMSFIVTASLAFYGRAKTEHEWVDAKVATTNRMTKLLNLANLAALICVISGYSSVNFTNAQGDVINPKLPTETKVGALLYLALFIIIAFLTLFTLPSPSAQERDPRLLKLAILYVTPLMLARAAYSIYSTFSGTILLPKNIWVKFVFQYLSEFIAVCIYTALGYLLGKVTQAKYAVDEEMASSNPIIEAKWGANQSSESSQPVPISYQPPRK